MLYPSNQYQGLERAEIAVLFLDLIHPSNLLNAYFPNNFGRTSYPNGTYMCAKFGGNLYDALGELKTH